MVELERPDASAVSFREVTRGATILTMPTKKPGPTTWIAAAALLCLVNSVSAQGRVFPPAFTLGASVYNSPLAPQYGFDLGVSEPIRLTRHLRITPAAYLGRFRAGASLDCILIAGGGCLNPPDPEWMFSASVTIGLQLAQKETPFLEIGPVLEHSLAATTPGQKHQFFAPQVEGGFRFSRGWGRWSVSLRWRSIDRWERTGPFNELGFYVGIWPGKSR